MGWTQFAFIHTILHGWYFTIVFIFFLFFFLFCFSISFSFAIELFLVYLHYPYIVYVLAKMNKKIRRIRRRKWEKNFIYLCLPPHLCPTANNKIRCFNVCYMYTYTVWPFFVQNPFPFICCSNSSFFFFVNIFGIFHIEIFIQALCLIQCKIPNNFFLSFFIDTNRSCLKYGSILYAPNKIEFDQWNRKRARVFMMIKKISGCISWERKFVGSPTSLCPIGKKTYKNFFTLSIFS